MRNRHAIPLYTKLRLRPVMNRVLPLTLGLALVASGCDKKTDPPPEKEAAGQAAGAGKAKPPGQDPAQGTTPAADKPASAGSNAEVRPPKAEDLKEYTKDLKGKGKLMATIQTTMGDYNCELFADKTPMTVANFVGLARGLKPWKHPETGEIHKKPYYDGILFHRVIPKFMVQTGDPLGQGRGGPGYRFADEFHPDLRHSEGGILSMANSGPGTNGSQFFITETATPWLDKRHTVFGQCKEVDLVKKMTGVPRGPGDRPNEEIKITKMTISRGK